MGFLIFTRDVLTINKELTFQKSRQLRQHFVFDEAAKLYEWRKSMKAEVKALQNRGCCRMIRTPEGISLIKSKFVFKLKRDWTGKMVKRKSRLVVL